jgi:hypothetical protein
MPRAGSEPERGDGEDGLMIFRKVRPEKKEMLEKKQARLGV